jgi:hypothetical protein
LATERIGDYTIVKELGSGGMGAVEALERHESRLGSEDRMEMRFVLWQVTGDRAYLEAAHALFRFMRDDAPEECREAMVANYPLHGDIVAAWEGRGAAGQDRGAG